MGLLQPIKTRLKHLLNKRGLSLARTDELTRLANKHGSDKGTRFSSHGYTRVYSRMFEPIRQDELILLEMGILRPDLDGRRANNAIEGPSDAAGLQAPSLEMWRAFFPRARIFGFDIDDFSGVRMEGCTTVRGDVSSSADLDRLAREIGKSINILIDDASHVSHHQQIALGHLFPHVRSGGLYIIEDLHWQDPALEDKGVPKTRDVLRKLQAVGILQSPVFTEQQGRYITDNLAAIRLYDSLTTGVDDGTDALAVLMKR